MKAVRVVRGVVNTIGFPFYLANLGMNRRREVEAPGELVKINGRLIHTIISGNESTNCTVVLDAGLSCCSLDWIHVQPEISKLAKVISFDRAGYGWSSPSKDNYTSEDVVKDIKGILDKTSAKPPYILVGHSFGTLNMRLFASTYPELVNSLILIDGVHENRYLHENWDENRKKAYQKNLLLYQFGYITSEIGLPRLLRHGVGRSRLNGEHQSYADYISYQPKAFEALYKEFLNSETSARQVADAKPLPNDLPVTVISSNNPDPIWREHQQLLCGLSSNTDFIQTDHGHSIHLENPTLITEIINKKVHQFKEEIYENDRLNRRDELGINC
ncbi:alpha/beta hydrolase [Ornithinibacillus halophilus]|uniref:Pimeloyl-ACP methyl ester carboxylesterase n=1 Tax=Ornithinibacillus halophilus TaxID=930117 RepID=A0A1M5HQX8_9BACI|nr:alpha/beta fold hydrolase [Ornithinibacillus halophilus]SHG18374.1 Pimeloyl-ACP methyl ester carboxylesterase [Ornithinibacillus halophilus]